jgi:hypothetical protein
MRIQKYFELIVSYPDSGDDSKIKMMTIGHVGI